MSKAEEGKAMIEDISRALNVERRALLGAFIRSPTVMTETKTTPPSRFTREEVDRMLRIEIDIDHEVELYRWYSETGQSAAWFDAKRQGPLTIQGVDVYIVIRLPAPGWRIVNPMVKP